MPQNSSTIHDNLQFNGARVEGVVWHVNLVEARIRNGTRMVVMETTRGIPTDSGIYNNYDKPRRRRLAHVMHPCQTYELSGSLAQSRDKPRRRRLAHVMHPGQTYELSGSLAQSRDRGTWDDWSLCGA